MRRTISISMANQDAQSIMRPSQQAEEEGADPTQEQQQQPGTSRMDTHPERGALLSPLPVNVPRANLMDLLWVSNRIIDTLGSSLNRVKEEHTAAIQLVREEHNVGMWQLRASIEHFFPAK